MGWGALSATAGKEDSYPLGMRDLRAVGGGGGAEGSQFCGLRTPGRGWRRVLRARKRGWEAYWLALVIHT